MSIIVTCPSCGKTLQARDEWAGQSVRCPSCQELLTVPSLKEGGLAPGPLAEAPRRRPRDEEDEDRPLSRRRPRDEEDEDRPLSRRRPRDEEDEDRPRSRRRYRDDYDDDFPVRRKRRGGGDLRDLKEFSPVLVVVLHFVTCGLFTWIWLGMLHGKLPRVRNDDPGAGAAIGFMLIPFFNLYWVFFSYRRLVLRLNEAREDAGLEPSVPDGLALTMCIVMLIPYVGLLSWAILMPIFAAIVQSRVNELAQTVNA